MSTMHPANTKPTTLRALANAPTNPPPLEESVLIVIDAQNEYGPDGRLPLQGLPAALGNIERLLADARVKGSPVIHVAHGGKTGGLFDLTLGGRFLDAAAPENGESIVHKSLPNSFAGTSLEELLRDLGIANLTLVGFMTHMCVSSTARAALDLGFTTSVVADATATRDLPGVNQQAVVPAGLVHDSALAALADRFSVVTDADSLLLKG